ncbi:hypothetical protein ACFQHO_03275 [Actinomadura yumaensis]|uniref:hypothetical protein n=1 Tax=Actinomadura yumaensis TaxID=111807 RepID=UPI0036206BAF
MISRVAAARSRAPSSGRSRSAWARTSARSCSSTFAISGALSRCPDRTARAAPTAVAEGAPSSARIARHASRNSPAAVAVTVKPAVSWT